MAGGLSMSDGGDGPAEPRARCGGAQNLSMEGCGKGVNWTGEQLAIGVRKTPSRDQIRIEENIKTRTLENHKGAAPKCAPALNLSATRPYESALGAKAGRPKKMSRKSQISEMMGTSSISVFEVFAVLCKDLDVPW